MSDFSKGPWFVGELDKNGQVIVRNADIEIATCWHHCVGAIEKEMHANARIMAASPELLKALIRAEHKLSAYVGVCSGDKELTETILPMSRAAIAKAEGP